jgi:hypothetical protein
VQTYLTATQYVATARLLLQDNVTPYRYPDTTLVTALNVALDELGRLRPDIWLDLKYHNPILKGDIRDGVPMPYTTNDISVDSSGNYNVTQGTVIPVPNKYRVVVDWFVSGWAQILDVADTQDQRAQAFMAKFQQHLTTLNAA